jgi:fructose 5-dehydrogenase small subunit
MEKDTRELSGPARDAAGFTGGVSRRTLMIASMAALSSALGEFALCVPSAEGRDLNEDADIFLKTSCAVTGFQDLDPEMATRLQAAMRKAFPGYDTQFAALARLAAGGGQPGEILARADTPDLELAVMTLVAAWYMGSAANTLNAPMVAYYDALMYRPTRDALPVPTYCFGTPGWWTQDPPALGVPVAAPVMASAPAPAPAAVESKAPPASPVLSPRRPSQEH